MRIALFDWTAGGHHALYLARCAEALAGAAETVAIAPEESLAAVPGEVVSLGAARPREDPTRPLRPQTRALAAAELALLREHAARADADHLVHLAGDHLLRALVREPPLPVPVTLLVVHPRAHYPRTYASPLPPRGRLRALFLEELVRRWRRRPDAHAVLTLDERAARGWARRPGAPAHWFPEPPVSEPPPADGVREGCVVYGVLSRHKGIEAVTRALVRTPAAGPLVLAGPVQPEYEPALARCLADLREAGVAVDARLRPHSEEEGLAALGAARCAVLAYPDHIGMSRVLLEACVAGTPVVVHDYGLVGHLVRTHGIGLAVDAWDPRVLGGAIAAVARDAERYAGALARFAARYGADAFRAALLAPFARTMAASLST